MVWWIENRIWWSWVVFWLLWLVTALRTKPTVRVQSGGSRLLQAAVLICGWMVVVDYRGWMEQEWLTVRLMPESLPVMLAGAVLTLSGLAFAVWARFTLGRNWSGRVTLKEHHELVLRGPYQVVRHPIYTGILIALLGTALIGGIARGFVGLLIVGFGLWLKSQTEEQFMLQHFGPRYADYRRQVRALIPFVL